MLESFLRLFNDSPAELRSKIVGIYAMLIAFNVGAWAWAFAAFHGQPVLLGTALLAYRSGCAMRSTPITSPRSTTSRAS